MAKTYAFYADMTNDVVFRIPALIIVGLDTYVKV